MHVHAGSTHPICPSDHPRPRRDRDGAARPFARVTTGSSRTRLVRERPSKRTSPYGMSPALRSRSSRLGFLACTSHSRAMRDAASTCLPVRAHTSRRSRSRVTASSYPFGCFVAMSLSTPLHAAASRPAREARWRSRASAVMRSWRAFSRASRAASLLRRCSACASAASRISPTVRALIVAGAPPSERDARKRWSSSPGRWGSAPPTRRTTWRSSPPREASTPTPRIQRRQECPDPGWRLLLPRPGRHRPSGMWPTLESGAELSEAWWARRLQGILLEFTDSGGAEPSEVQRA
jgi:hypothetical protein